MTETIVLDPSAVATGRTQLDITGWVSAEGVDWGDAAIQAYMADQAVGSSTVDYRLPNRIIKIPLVLRTVGATSFSTIRTNLQQKVGLFHREGGWLMRQVGATPLYADVMNATLHLGGSWLQAYRDADVQAWLQIEALPDWYGDEITLSDHVETTKPDLIFTEATVNGNYPGRVRIVVDNDQAGVDQHGLLWGFRSRHYSGSATAALAYEAEGLQPLDAAATFAHAGASGGTVIRHAALPGGAWCPVLATNIGGTAFLTHVGSYRVWARTYSGTATPQLKFLWDVGDMTGPTENAPQILPGGGNFYLTDLGSIRIAPPGGDTACRWQGVIQAKAATQGDQIEVDRLWFQPLDEGAGRLTAVQLPSPFGVNFTMTAGTAADDSGTGTVAWSNPTKVIMEDADPATVTLNTGATSHYLKATEFGFNIGTGSTISGIQVSIKRRGSVGAIADSRVRLVKAGAIQTPDKADTFTPWPLALAWKTYGGATDLWSGTWTPSDINNTGFGVALSAQDTFSGDQAVVDVIKITVYYTTAGGFSTTADAVIFASRSAELRTEGMIRQDVSGSASGPQSSVMGDLPRIPPGIESRAVEVFLKASRGNFADEPDAGIDDISARLFYRPSYLFTS